MKLFKKKHNSKKIPTNIIVEVDGQKYCVTEVTISDLVIVPLTDRRAMAQALGM